MRPRAGTWPRAPLRRPLKTHRTDSVMKSGSREPHGPRTMAGHRRGTLEQESREGLEMRVGRATDHGATARVLLDQSTRGEEPEALGKGEGRKPGPVANLADREPFVAGAHKQAQHREPRFGAALGECQRCFFECLGGRRVRCVTVFNIHKTRYIVLCFCRQLSVYGEPCALRSKLQRSTLNLDSFVATSFADLDRKLRANDVRVS